MEGVGFGEEGGEGAMFGGLDEDDDAFWANVDARFVLCLLSSVVFLKPSFFFIASCSTDSIIVIIIHRLSSGFLNFSNTKN